MASYRIEFKHSAERDLRRIRVAIVARILRGIEELSESPFPRQSIKLSGPERIYRLRIGVYRVIYEVDTGQEIITVHYIRHHREAYRAT